MVSGVTVPRIADAIGGEQKPYYRRIEQIHEKLDASMVAAGVTVEESWALGLSQRACRGWLRPCALTQISSPRLRVIGYATPTMHVLPQTPLDWVLLAVAAATAVIIFVSLQDFFLDSRTNNPKLRALQDVGVGFAVVHFFGLALLGSQGPAWAGAAIVMYVLATLLFLATLETARRVHLPRTFVDDPLPKALITTGPFAVVRHPFYASYSLAWLAAPVATHGPLITLSGVLAVAVYVLAARREERQLEAQFGDAYRAYRNRTGMMVPSLRGLVRARR